MMIDDRYLNDFSKEFGETINVIYKRDYDKADAQKFAQTAKEYNISFVQIKQLSKNSKDEPTPYNIYLYLHDFSWFKNQFPMINSNENDQEGNKFKSSDGSRFLTRKQIKVLPFEQIPKQYLTGDYQVHGEKSDIEKFIQTLKSKNDAFEITPDSSFNVASHLSVAYINIYKMLVFILVVAFVFCLYIYNGKLTKELSIIMLLGQSKIRFALEKSLSLLVVPSLLAFLISYSVIGCLVQKMSIAIFLRAMTPIFRYFITTSVICILVQFMLLYLKTFHINITEQIKGAHKTYKKAIILVKMLILSMVTYLLVVTVIGTKDYLSIRPYVNTWKQTRNYADVSFTVPWTFVKNSDKDDMLVAPKIGKLWELLEEKGAVLFMPAFRERENMMHDEEYVNTLPFNGNYAFINRNYLGVMPIIDAQGQHIKIDQMNPSEWIILVPEHINVSNKDKIGVRETHQHEHKGGKKGLSERYIPIKSGQRLFSFDSQGRINKPETEDYTLILIDGKELSDLTAIKVPSLINGYYHSYVKDSNNPLKELMPLIKKSNLESYVIYTSTVYDEVREKIEVYKTTAFVNFVAMLLSLLILVTLFKIDQETYYYHEGQRIDVSQLMGYRFIDIHRKKIFLNIVIYVLSFVGFIAIGVSSMFLKSDGVFVPRDGWTNEWISFSVLFVGVVLMISFIFDTLLLKRNDKQIAVRLKEGQ